MRASPYRLIHPYHPPPSSPMQYHSRRCCRAPPTTTRKLSHTGPLSPDVSPSPTFPATDNLLSVASRASYRQPVTLIFGWSATDTCHWKTSVSLQSIALLQVRTPNGRDSPDRYDIARGTFIPRILAPVVESPLAFPPGLVINNTLDKPISIKANHTFMR